MIDFHNHVLPEVDDGSKSLEISLCMLKNAEEQGITNVVNTVHFQHPKVEFNEISWSINQGKSDNLNVYKRLTDSWAEGNLNNKFKGGESPNEIAVRLNRGISHIINEKFNKILICIHGRALRVLLSLILDKDLTRMDNYLHSNTCLYIIYYDRGKFILKEKNNTDHLT